MKQQTIIDDLLRYACLADVQITQAQASLMARHLELVFEANRRVNLTRIENEHNAVRRHVVDSLTILRELAAAPSGVVLDVEQARGSPASLWLSAVRAK